MSYLKGESVSLAIGLEDPTARGTFKDPQNFIPARTPSGINVDIIKKIIKETRGSGVSSQGSEIIQRKAKGDLEFNLRVESIGFILKSLLGLCVSTVKETTAINHVFTKLLNNPQHPTISLALHQPNLQDYAYKGGLATKLEIRTPVDDLVNATINFIAVDEDEHADFVQVFRADDYHFRPQDISIKLATNLAGLDAAEVITLKNFRVSADNAGKPQQNLGSLVPADNLADDLEILGSMVLDYEGDTYHDLVKDGTYKAMRIELERSDITIGATSHPKIRIDLSKVSFETHTPDRPMDDIVKDNLEFMAHGTDDGSEPIEVTITNERVGYSPQTAITKELKYDIA